MFPNISTGTKRKIGAGVAAAALATLVAGTWGVVRAGGPLGDRADLNPCAAKTINPCAAKTLNPCAAKTLNPCAAKTLNPCAAKTLNPCAAKAGANPCGARVLNPCNPCNPCGGAAAVNPCRVKQPAGVRLARGSQGDLRAQGEKLWNDRALGRSGLACASCHIGSYGQMKPSFAEPYPHEVAMPKQMAGLSRVNAAEMVQFCMIVPMAAEPLPWDSTELAALTAWVEGIQPGYRPVGGANPCNPCSMKRNPCNP